MRSPGGRAKPWESSGRSRRASGQETSVWGKWGTTTGGRSSPGPPDTGMDRSNSSLPGPVLAYEALKCVR
jgi:hypothetical protein